VSSSNLLGRESGYMSSGKGASSSKDPKRQPSVKHPHRVLPLVIRMRDNIEQIFSRYVGPISAELSAEEFDRWRQEGQVGPTGLHRYISRLAKYIPDDGPRREFMGYASRCIQAMAVVKR
jgi:hypothetical protein